MSAPHKARNVRRNVKDGRLAIKQRNWQKKLELWQAEHEAWKLKVERDAALYSEKDAELIEQLNKIQWPAKKESWWKRFLANPFWRNNW